MSLSLLDRQGAAKPMAEINMVPLIDVMLVLVVVLIVTAPLLTHVVKLDLPSASSQPLVPAPAAIELSITADGELYWGAEWVARESLLQRWESTAQRVPIPALHLRADKAVPFGLVDEVLSEAARVGITQVSVLSAPSATAPP